MTVKKIGILTSGGDCAGLNAAIRAVVHRAAGHYGWQVIGIREGTHGLLARPPSVEELRIDGSEPSILRWGGTILGTTNQGNPFAFTMPDGAVQDRSNEVIEGVRLLGLDALIGVGGDGSFAILRKLAQQGGIAMVGIPKTIDNDIGITEASIGFSTAVEVATDALDKLQPTAASHSRVMVLEVMGRDAGHIALAAGIAGGADIILVPEITWSVEALARKVEQLRRTGRNFALVVVAEAVKREDGKPVKQAHGSGAVTYGGIGHYVGEKIAQATGAETRVTVLGHVQRGGSPGARDRIIASAFGVHAVELIAQGKFDHMVVWSDRQVKAVPIAEAIGQYQAVDPKDALVQTARGLGISFGD
ncbi:MAG: 6-phosphofructokinase [Alphaproteobacteria bacterium]|jgi:6-phosphofructokinase 1|nr:6-phosphofructokinase [Alphaproteobacteria bacterium]